MFHRVATLLLIAAFYVLVEAHNVKNYEDLPFSISFLSQADKTKYGKVNKAERGRFLKEVFVAASDSEKKSIGEEVLPKCYSWWMTEAQRNEIEALHALNDHVTCKQRVHQFLSEQPKEKQDHINSYWEFCEHVWYLTTHHHHKHNHHLAHKHATNHQHIKRLTRHSHNSFDEFASDHLSWLSAEERAVVKKLHEDNKEKARDKVLELFDASSGDKKVKAITQLQAACRELVITILGENVAKELKTMKESGATNEQLSKKVTDLLALVKDDQKKAKALEHKYACEKIYNLQKPTKTRRSVQHHDLESKLRSEWKWLTDKQKDELRQLKTAGKNNDFLLNKVFEFFKIASDKNAAEDGLQTSCGGAVLTILGPQKAEELKKFMSQGSKPEIYEAKVKELLNSAPKKSLTKIQENCKLVFTQASRKRRHVEDHQHKTFEDFVKSHLSWLTDVQKTQLLELKKNNKDSSEIQAKIMEFYDATTGAVKEKATTDLQSGCKEVLKNTLSAEQYAEIKKMTNSGMAKSNIAAKIAEFTAKVTDKQKLADVKKYEASCKKLFGVMPRHRRLAHEAPLNIYDYAAYAYLNL